jgi:hypothetical protein
MDGGPNGWLSSDCSINRFCNATKAHFNYCDGGSFAGSLALPLMFNNTPLFFRGASIFDASVKQLLSLGMASSAQNIILKGCSAGGLATFHHSDYFAEWMKSAVPEARVVAAPDAGFFRDHLTYAKTPLYTPQMAWVFNTMNITQVSTDCLVARVADDPFRCFMAEFELPYIKTPLFLTQDLDDSWQMANVLALPCAPYTAGSCDAAELSAVADFRTDMLSALAPVFTSNVHGGFFSACIQHCHQNVVSWTQEEISNTTVSQAFELWWNGSSQRTWVDAPFDPSRKAHCRDTPYMLQ